MTRKPSQHPRFTHYLEYASLILAGCIARIIPQFCYPPLSGLMSWVWFLVFPFRRGVVLENLSIAFPNESPAWRRRVARQCMAHFTRMALEFQDLDRGGRKAIEKLMAGVDGMEHYREVGGSVKPLVFVTAHIGNWELAVSYLTAFHGLRVSVLAKPLHNPLVEKMVARVRDERGYEIIHTRDDLRQIVRATREGKALAFLADQDARRSGIFVMFFGRLASTFQGPALFAHRLNLPMLQSACVRQPDGRFRLQFAPPVYPDPKVEREAEIDRLTASHVRFLEEMIRKHPEQYFWFHKRWKTRPKPDSRIVRED